jgi:hypothetical protein
MNSFALAAVIFFSVFFDWPSNNEDGGLFSTRYEIPDSSLQQLSKKQAPAQFSTKPLGNYESIYPMGIFPATDDTLAIHDTLKCKIPAAVFQSFSKERQEYFLANPQLYMIVD